ncbi:hypothetical protein RF11_12982 [Thelohanellus kitauei]|uniref:Uncharacterized protein n=1 Tax=Thelohanellus kitauei TaxID=669202 RepID=A0A0C2MMX4_THEKT|nr:hypothetical protein RF11_12982 [Thelohanellus kitauei]
MLDVVDQVCLEHRKKFKNISLYRRTIARLIEAINEDLKSQLTRRVPSLQHFSQILDESTDLHDTARLLIFERNFTKIRNHLRIAVNRINKRHYYPMRYFQMCGKCFA